MSVCRSVRSTSEKGLADSIREFVYADSLSFRVDISNSTPGTKNLSGKKRRNKFSSFCVLSFSSDFRFFFFFFLSFRFNSRSLFFRFLSFESGTYDWAERTLHTHCMGYQEVSLCLNVGRIARKNSSALH